MANEIEKRPAADQQGALEVRQQVNQIQYLMREVLKDGEHFGTIKGCGNKPTLLQSGAEKIAYMFHFVPEYTVTRINLNNGHREYEVCCTLRQRDTSQVMGGGLGLCTTMESKYRYRWEGYGNNRHRVENQDIADTYNTVLKMAKKRAFVDAVKSTTAASDIFTQDIEDLPYMEYESEQATVVEQAPPIEHSDASPVRAAWDAVGAAKEQALALGITEAGLKSWAAVTFVTADGSPKPMREYSPEEVYAFRDYIDGLVADKAQADVPAEYEAEYEYEPADLADHDIAF